MRNLAGLQCSKCTAGNRSRTRPMPALCLISLSPQLQIRWTLHNFDHNINRYCHIGGSTCLKNIKLELLSVAVSWRVLHNFGHSTQIIARPWGRLLPTEDAEGDHVNDNAPHANHPQLRKNVDKVFALGCKQSDTVNNRRQRQEGRDVL